MGQRAVAMFVVVIGLMPGCRGTKAFRDADAAGHHYFNNSGDPLPRWDFIWDRLSAYFGSSTPDRITVEHWDGAASRFFPRTDTIYLNASGDKVDVVAHESTHLCNHNLTSGASSTNRFRFLDEGFAEIMGCAVAGNDGYKDYALAVAKEEHQKGNVSFALVQNWATYFGTSESAPSTLNWRAYQVGSSFEYMVEDTRGADVLHSLFVDIGVTRDLATTIKNVLFSTESAVEQEWKDYLDRVEVDASPPAVIAMSPADTATEVPLDTSEISVTFNRTMQRTICVGTPCGDTGICYRNAYWKTRNVLAVKVEGSLKPAYQYRLSLGVRECYLKSYAGTALPHSTWQFSTAGQ